MKIKVLGCAGSAFPGHNLSSLLLNHKILFDAGSLTHVLAEKDQLTIEHVFITHAHLDHIMGIPFLADNIIAGNLKHRVTLIAIPSVVRTIKKNLFNSAVWPDFTEIPNIEDSILKLVPLKIGKSIKLDEYTVIPYRVNHPVPAVGYLVEDKQAMRFFLTGDTGPTDGTWKKLKGKRIHCLFIDVSFPSAMRDLAIRTGHLTPTLLMDELAKIDPPPEKIYATHLKTQHYEKIKKEVEALGIRNLQVLRDGEEIDI